MAQRYPVEAADAYLIWTGFRQLTVTIELSGKLDLTRLRLALTQIVDAYPILGSRLVEGWWRAYWEVMPAETAPDTVVVRSWDGLETTTWRWAGEPLKGPLQLLVGQGDRDLLIVKFDHGLGDFVGPEKVTAAYSGYFLDGCWTVWPLRRVGRRAASPW